VIFKFISAIAKLPAKKRITQLTQQQNAILLKSMPPMQSMQSSISIIPINQAAAPHSNTITPTSTTASTILNSSSNNNNNNSKTASSLSEPMEMEDDDDEEINVHDDDSPLDMRITKHDSDSDSVRPSVIRRAPSFKETNSNSPSGKLKKKMQQKTKVMSLFLLFLDPSSTCDPFIDEHFRRSLGTDYDLIMRNKQMQLQEQEQKKRMIEEQILLQQQQQQQQQQQAVALHSQQQNILKLKHHKKHQIHQHHQQMLSIQQENQLPIQTIQTPPSSVVTSATAAVAPSPAIGVVAAQKQVVITEHSDADEMSVDDHFAKALGENTWKKIQSENK
jgi:hypothetical protein